MANRLGFEPRQTVLETVMLPLHHRNMVPSIRLEQITFSLQGNCTTIVLTRQNSKVHTGYFGLDLLIRLYRSCTSFKVSYNAYLLTSPDSSFEADVVLLRLPSLFCFICLFACPTNNLIQFSIPP